LMWTMMEEAPSPAFQHLTTTPSRTLADAKRNGYLLLLGFEAPSGQDPIHSGYERKPSENDADKIATCIRGPRGDAGGGQTNASAPVLHELFRGRDPVGRFRAEGDTLTGWASQSESALGRYQQWLKLPFEDWGYGQSVSLPCAAIAFAHQLYVAEGFVQGTEIGVDRLEADMEAWRRTLRQANTLAMKSLAMQALHDNAAVASGLLIKPDFDGKLLGRLTDMVRPLDQAELSLQWPMQNELTLASKGFAAQLKTARADLPIHAAVVAMLPLPAQRRLNQYAAYYEASSKAAEEERYGALPKRSQYMRVSPESVIDSVANPIEHLIGLEPLPLWDRYNGLVVDLDAHLRLVSLQAWLRRGSQDADLLARIAKAGQKFYDPYTGFPMLVNLKKGVLYSVGHDGRDQDADPETDVVAVIPVNQTPSLSLSR
jgi:hypothetical protein